MSNSENENIEPGQPANQRGDAWRPRDDEQDATRPPRRRTNDATNAHGQAAASQPLSGDVDNEQPAEPPGQAFPGKEASSTPFTGRREQDFSSMERPPEIRWGEPLPTPPERRYSLEPPDATPRRESAPEPLTVAGSTPSTGSPAHHASASTSPGGPVPGKRRVNILVGALTGALLCLLLGGLAGWQISKHNEKLQTSGLNGYKNGAMTPEEVIARDRQAVVQINVKMAKGGSVGSGVIIDSQGHIITNDHVVAGGQTYNVVLFDGTSRPARLVGVDPADDLAVVKINPPSNMYVMPIGDSSKLEVGNTVLAIGNPLGITQTVTQGIVSALGRTVSEGRGGGAIVDAVQTDAPINPGNSGGALVSLDGNLIGIPTLVAIDPEFKTPANGVGFAVPSNRVKFIAPQLIQYGKVVHSGRAALEASVTTVDSQVAAQAGLSVDHGVLIVKTVLGGAAARAGLKTGDVITQVNNQAIDNVSDLSDALLSYDPGTTVSANYTRGTQQNQAKIKLGELKVS